MKKILKLNEISDEVNGIIGKNYEYSDVVKDPDGIMLRSFNMHSYPFNDNLLAVARAGAGVNNIPIPALSEKGIVVFNTPGANANAVKELVIAALLMSSRKIIEGVKWTDSLIGKGEEVAKLVEKGKNQFVGPEIKSRVLGVFGLGAIGAKVANAASELDMTVYGYDPYISVDTAWTLSRRVKQEKSLKSLFAESDYITLHIPLTSETKGIINKKTISQMKDGVHIINCARGELVNNDDIKEAIASGKVAKYFTDFPCEELLGVPNIICCPHLGASTPEAEDNCAIMAAKQLDEYLKYGNITNSVNFPTVVAPMTSNQRITIVHANKSNMIAAASTVLSDAKLNISNMVSASKGDLAYMLLDIDTKVGDSVLATLQAVDGFYRIRLIKAK